MLDHLLEATAERILPGEAITPACSSRDLTHPAMTVREAAFGSPLILRKRFLHPKRRFSSSKKIVRFTHYTGSKFFWVELEDNLQPDCLYVAVSVLDPNMGQKMI